MQYRAWADRYIALAAHYRITEQTEIEQMALKRAAYHLRMAGGGQ